MNSKALLPQSQQQTQIQGEGGMHYFGKLSEEGQGQPESGSGANSNTSSQHQQYVLQQQSQSQYQSKQQPQAVKKIISPQKPVFNNNKAVLYAFFDY